MEYLIHLALNSGTVFKRVIKPNLCIPYDNSETSLSKAHIRTVILPKMFIFKKSSE